VSEDADVLKMWRLEIDYAENTEHTTEQSDSSLVCHYKWMAIRDLAAALRAEREQAAAAMSYFLDPNDPGSPPKYTEEYGPTLLNQIQGLAGYYEEMMDEDRAEVERLKARVAELEKQHTDDDVRFALHLNRAMAAEEKSALAEMRAIGQKAHIEAVEAKVAELREALSGHRDLDQTYALTDAEKRIAELQARVAELEADAKLGRMVREMSEELGLYRNGPSWRGSANGAG